MATMRLDKLLGNMGFGTRKEIKQFAKEGLIKLDGKVVKDTSQHVDITEQQIEFNGEIVEYRQYIYLLMNKPQGVISATEDLRERTVLDLLDDKYINFEPFPVGRLDKDTEGLLVLTNDGKMAHELLSPRKHVPKKYFAEIEGKVTSDDVERFREGLTLDDGYETLPAELTILSAGELSEIEVTIHEGKFHQVKRMFLAVGKKVKFLKRIQMGNLTLDPELLPGQYRELSAEELIRLKME
jgi:16S rRNA pseudouridine516 synthase